MFNRARKMENKIIKILFVVVVLHVTPYTLHEVCADFEDLGWGVASAGLSNSIMFSKRIPSLISVNPAASSFIKRPVVGAEYENLYPNLTDGSKLTRNILTYSQQSEFYGYGAGVEDFSLDSLYKERIYLFNYSKKFRNDWFGGFNFRLLQKKYGSDDYTNNAIGSDGVASGKMDPLFGANGFKKSGYTFDVGVSRIFMNSWYLSGAVSYLTSPDVSLSGGDKRKPTFTMGASFERHLVTVGSMFRFHDGDYSTSVGFERGLQNRLFKVRGGLSIGNSQVRLLSVGFGYVHLNQFLLDYAWTYPLVGLKETGGRHRFSISVYLGKEEEEVLEEGPALPEVEQYLEKAREAVAGGDWLTAVSFSKKVLSLEPENDEAKEILSKSIAELRNFSKPFIDEGMYFLEKGKFNIAEVKFNTALSINPDDEVLKENCLKIKKITRIIPQAVKKDKISRLLRIAVNAYINDDVMLALNASIYASQIDFSGIGSKLRDLMKREYPSRYQQIKLVAGINLVEQKLYVALKNIYNARYDIAIMECDDVLKLEPENILAMTRLGSAYYALGNKTQAVSVWTKALEYEPDNKDILDFLGLSGKTVKSVYKKKKESEASAKKTVKDSYLHGIAAMKRGEFEKAKSLFEKSLSRKVYDKSSLDYQKKSSSKLKECEEKLKKKGGTDLKMMKVYFGLGMSYYKKGEHRKAVAEFEKVLKIKPNHPQSRKMIDLCRRKMKK